MASIGGSIKRRTTKHPRCTLCEHSSFVANVIKLCHPQHYMEVQQLIEYALSSDVSYSQNATDLRNHRVFAIRVSLPLSSAFSADVARPEQMASLM